SFEVAGEEVDAAGRQSGGLDPVERAGVSALLNVAEDGLSGVEQLTALLFQQRGEEAGGVDGVGSLAADHHPQPSAGAESFGQRLDIGGQVVEGDALLG